MELIMVEVPKILLETLTIQGYFRVFYQLLPELDGSHRKTYEWLEELRESYDMPRRYDNYQSFKSAKTNLLCSGVYVIR